MKDPIPYIIGFLFAIVVMIVGLDTGMITVSSQQPSAPTSTIYKYELIFATPSSFKWIGEYTDQNEMLSAIYSLWDSTHTDTLDSGTTKQKCYGYDGQSACIPVHQMPCNQIFPDGIIEQNMPDTDGKCWAQEGETVYPEAPTSTYVSQNDIWTCLATGQMIPLPSGAADPFWREMNGACGLKTVFSTSAPTTTPQVKTWSCPTTYLNSNDVWETINLPAKASSKPDSNCVEVTNQ